jgi:glycine/D-amino acid oxidase-like deaminating enzyme
MPQISDKDLYGGIYLPGDGQLDPYTTTTSMANFAKESAWKFTPTPA